MPSLSVVVPATDQPQTLQRCTAAIEAADDPPEETIVVDGPSALSAAAARNVGAERATGDVVVFVDADVEVHADVFTRIRQAFSADPGLAALYGSYDDEPNAPGTVSVFRNLLHHHVHQTNAGPAETFWTGLGAIRRKTFVTTGGFDEDRFPHPSIEDIELGDRLAASGKRVMLDPAIQGTHLKAWTVRSMIWTDFARRGTPWVHMQIRNRRLSSALNCGWRHRLSAVSCALALLGPAIGRPLLALGAVGLLIGLNAAFYALLVRQLGPFHAVAGMGLHGLHHLVSVAAVASGVVVALAVGMSSAWRRREAAVRPGPQMGA